MGRLKRQAGALAGCFAVILLATSWPMPGFGAEKPASYRFQADGLACPFCAYGIEKQVGRLPGVAAVSIDMKSGTVTITMTAGASLTEAEAKRAVDRSGFTMRDFKRGEER